MSRKLLFALKYQSFFLNLYSGLSFALFFLLSLWIYTKGGLPLLLRQYPSTAFLTGLSFFAYGQLGELRRLMPFSKYHPVIFFAQTVLLFGVSFEFQDLGPAYWGLLPSLMGVMVLGRSWMMGHRNSAHRLRAYLALLFLAELSFGLKALREDWFSSRGLVSLGFFFLFALCLVGITFVARKLPLLFFAKSLKRSSYALSFSSSHEKERFFFHDMVNHLHALSLKLSYRVGKSRGLEREEIPLLLQEVMALEAIMEDHFDFKHRNLDHSWGHLSFEEIRPLLEAQLGVFFKGGEDSPSSFSLAFKGIFSPEKKDLFSCFSPRPLIPFASFYRIFTNLIKNAAEARSEWVEVIIDGDYERIMVTLKNNLKVLQGDQSSLGESLANVISLPERKSSSPGFGLRAVESLCQSHGGDFNFRIEKGDWVGEFSLCYKEALCSEEQYLKLMKEGHFQKPKSA